MKRAISRGFTLLELLLFITISSWLMILLYEWAATVSIRISHLAKNQHHFSDLRAAHALLCRDLYAVPSAITSWKKITPHELIWSVGGGEDRGWLCTHNDLVRVKGVFDTIQKKWIKRRSLIVAHNVRSLDFCVYQENQRIIAIEGRIMSRDITLKRRILLRSRVIP